MLSIVLNSHNLQQWERTDPVQSQGVGEFRVGISMSQMLTKAWKSSSDSSLETAGIQMNEVPGPGKPVSGALMKMKESPRQTQAQG